MKYLLDTHSLLWWLNEDPHLSVHARDLISDPANNVFVSAASAWEIATKFAKGRLPTASVLIPDFHELLLKERFTELSINSRHMLRSAALPGEHKDPFDRILAAQAIIENMILISLDREISGFGVTTAW